VVLAAQLVAAAPPVSAALTFHLLLRLLDRATLLHSIAEAYEERSVEKARAAVRRARRAAIRSGSATGVEGAPGDGKPATSKQRFKADGGHDGGQQFLVMPAAAAERVPSSARPPTGAAGIHVQLAELRIRAQEAFAAGERVTAEVVGRWLGVSPCIGRRRLASLLDDDPMLAETLSRD
jgi:hypothetical protein